MPMPMPITTPTITTTITHKWVMVIAQLISCAKNWKNAVEYSCPYLSPSKHKFLSGKLQKKKKNKSAKLIFVDLFSIVATEQYVAPLQCNVNIHRIIPCQFHFPEHCLVYYFLNLSSLWDLFLILYSEL